MDSDLLARLAAALAPSYDVEAEIGRGGMAIVYRARDTRLKRGVAVKVLPPELAFRNDIRTRFLREAEMSARLSHPNIVPIYSVDERDGLVFFVMGLVEGESLGERIRRSGALPINDARRILREVADALAYAHSHGVVHRDIKPDNVLLDRASGRAMVTDFGIARAASDDDDGTRLTATGVAIGTPAYMSPEQCSGDREIDGRSDLYSLGTVAYQMLTGEPPFIGNNTPAIMVKHVTEKPVPLRQRRGDVPEDLERIVMRLLEKDPMNRFGNGAALVAALDGAPITPMAPIAPVAATRARDLDREIFSPDEARERAREVTREIVRRTVSRSVALTGVQGAYEISNLRDLGDLRETRREMRDERRRRKRGEHLSPAERISRVRRGLVSYAGTSLMLWGINAFTGDGFWWCLFPIGFMGLSTMGSIGRLWADGIPLRALVGGALPPETDTAAPALPLAAGSPSLPAGIGDDTLSGPFGGVLRQAISDDKTVNDLIGRLTDTERAMLPDVKGTADALFGRIVSLAGALHRLDQQLGTARLPDLDERIAQIEQQAGDTGDRARRLALLKRQREMIAELTTSRGRLLEQYESAGLLLQNLALDMIKVRSSGLDSALSGINSATVEARALAKEIGYVLEAAEELKAQTP